MNGGLGRMGTGERVGRHAGRVHAGAGTKPRPTMSAAYREARELVWAHRRRLLLGLALMLVSRLCGLVLPASSKWLIDEVVGRIETLLRERTG